MKGPPSIFNDVIGPIMVGPSSSHTAGPVRIGLMAGQLVKNRLTKVTIVFDPQGSFAAVNKEQWSDKGFVAGLLGWGTDQRELNLALEVAIKRGITIEFKIAHLDEGHPNAVQLMLADENGEITIIKAISLGGGMVEITEVNCFPVSIFGDYFELLIFTFNLSREALKKFQIKIQKMLIHFEISNVVMNGEAGLINIKTRNKVVHQVLDIINTLEGVVGTQQVGPVLPVLSKKHYSIPFRTAKEMELYASGKAQKLWELAIVYECERSGWAVGDIFDYMKTIVSVMRSSINDAPSQNIKGDRLINEKSWAARKVIEEGKFLDMGILSKSVSWALGVMNTSSSMGRIVAAPTAGSAGVLPGAILGVSEALGVAEEEAIKAVLGAGIIGVFISEMASFAAEECGCQAECGAASAMAAAGIVQLTGGSANQAIAAASLALQNLLGLVCDPVAGRVEIPCVGRNIMAVANAVTSANLVLTGFDPVIPLDEVIQAMYSVGSMMPSELRCTGKGGLSVTPTSQRKKLEFAH